MTRQQLRDTARMKLGETTPLFWTEAMLNQWIEDAQLDIVWRAKLKRTRGTFTTTATTRYTLSTIFPNFLRVVDGGVWIYDSGDTKWHKLTYMKKEDMDNLYSDWVNSTAAQPIHYMENYDEDILELWPLPQTSCIGTDYCRVYYSQKPATITSDAVEPDLPEVLHPAVIDFIVATGFESRGYGDLGNDHWEKYFSKIKSYLIEKENKEDEITIMKSVYNI
jgi:hypothetical protein